MPLLLTVLRGVVFGGFVFSATVALTDWAVRNRHLPPFGTVPLLMRRLSDPVLRPLQQRLVKSGHNPVEAPTWLFWLTLLIGLAVLGLAQWLITEVAEIGWALQGGPGGILRFVIEGVYSVLVIALFIRVVSTWFAVSPYSKWMRPVMRLTNWLVEPIRRLLPPMGMFDFSPLVAYAALYLANWLLLRLL
ncbi:MAG: YggT family protein [Gemmatimonadota bacterium]